MKGIPRRQHMTTERIVNEVRFERTDDGWVTHLCAHHIVVENTETRDGVSALGSPGVAWLRCWNYLNKQPEYDSPWLFDSLPFREAIQLMDIHPRIPSGTVFRIAYNEASDFYLGEHRHRTTEGEMKTVSFAVHAQDGAIVLNHLVLKIRT